MKKITLLLTLLLTLPACEPPDTTVHVGLLKIIGRQDISLEEGDSITVGCEVLPSEATNKTIIWNSSNEAIATVNNGTIRAISPGAVVISATSEDNKNAFVSFFVTVAKKKIPVSGVSLDKSTIEMRVTDSAKLTLSILPESAASRENIGVFWYVDGNGSYALDENGNVLQDKRQIILSQDGSFFARGDGQFAVCVKVDDGDFGASFTAKCEVKVKYKIPEPIDLGLSVYWSSINLGASTDKAYGPYYAWGETNHKEWCSRDNYQFYVSGDGWTTTEYYINIGSNISNTEYDAAHIQLGEGWRMPTVAECEELVNNCSWEKTIIDDIKGYKGTAPNNNTIFLSAAPDIFGMNYHCCYWTAQAPDSDSTRAYVLGENGEKPFASKELWGWRENGNSIRPVKDK